MKQLGMTQTRTGLSIIEDNNKMSQALLDKEKQKLNLQLDDIWDVLKPRIELGPRAWELHSQISYGKWQTSRSGKTYARILPLNYLSNWRIMSHIRDDRIILP